MLTSDLKGNICFANKIAETYGFIQDLAVRAFRVLGCRDVGRVDVIVDETDGPQLLEINTIPGFTAHSLLPKAAAEAVNSPTIATIQPVRSISVPKSAFTFRWREADLLGM